MRAIGNLVEALGQEFDFRVVCSDRDPMEHAPYAGIDEGKWNSVGLGKVFYCSSKRLDIVSLRRLIAQIQPDVCYFNSFFDPCFTIKPLLIRYLSLTPPIPSVIAPRGEFSPAALRIKALKKRIYITFVRRSRLYSNLVWQASSEYEAQDISRALAPVEGTANLVQSVCIVPDIITTSCEPPIFGNKWKPSDRLRLLFLSRIGPMKNLDGALSMLMKVKAEIDFRIIGPISDEQYWRRCRDLIRRLPPNVRATYSGPLEPTLVSQQMAQHDLLFLPTLGENFCYVVAEALGAGLPVLVSDRTPWRNLEARGIGWDLPLENSESFVNRIHYAASLSQREMADWHIRVKDYASRYLLFTKNVEQSRMLFWDVLRHPPRPR